MRELYLYFMLTWHELAGIPKGQGCFCGGPKGKRFSSGRGIELHMFSTSSGQP